jgi:hypothetical protein
VVSRGVQLANALSVWRAANNSHARRCGRSRTSFPPDTRPLREGAASCHEEVSDRTLV